MSRAEGEDIFCHPSRPSVLIETVYTLYISLECELAQRYKEHR